MTWSSSNVCSRLSNSHINICIPHMFSAANFKRLDAYVCLEIRPGYEKQKLPFLGWTITEKIYFATIIIILQELNTSMILMGANES